MRGKTPSQAVRAHVRATQQAIACVTNEVVRADGYDPATAPHALILSRGLPARLAGSIPVAFRLRQHYHLVHTSDVRDAWQVELTGYWYTFHIPDTMAELFAFHWHPDVAGVTFPHLHLEAGLAMRTDLIGVHVPTAHVALADVLRFAISELRVRPQRADWASIL